MSDRWRPLQRREYHLEHRENSSKVGSMKGRALYKRYVLLGGRFPPKFLKTDNLYMRRSKLTVEVDRSHFSLGGLREADEAGPMEGATGCKNIGTTRLRWKALVERENGGFDLTKTDLRPSFTEDYTAKGVGLRVANSHTSNHREDDFTTQETIRRFLDVFESRSLLSLKGGLRTGEEGMPSV
ncbi:hypothetical protein Tco_1300626 [Tanacetum coccineum]